MTIQTGEPNFVKDSTWLKASRHSGWTNRHMGARATFVWFGRGGSLPHAYLPRTPIFKWQEACGGRAGLVDRHGDGNYADYTVKLILPRNPNGVYLIKGGGPDVWRRFGVPKLWCKPQGVIHGKRCGVTENIGAAARGRWTESSGRSKREAA